MAIKDDLVKVKVQGRKAILNLTRLTLTAGVPYKVGAKLNLHVGREIVGTVTVVGVTRERNLFEHQVVQPRKLHDAERKLDYQRRTGLRK